MFKTEKIITRKKTKSNKDFCLRKQEKALSTFYSFLVEKVDRGTIAQSELSEIGPNELLSKRLKNNPTLYQA